MRVCEYSYFNIVLTGYTLFSCYLTCISNIKIELG